VQTTGLDLVKVIRDLAEIDFHRQLNALVEEHAAECRGRPRDRSHLITANELLHAKAVARALASLFELPSDESEAAACDLLLPHPRRTAALELIDYYLGSDATDAKLASERQRRLVQ
jgi:hypothetical protein